MKKKFMFWLWSYAEERDFNDSWPTWFWSWLLMKLDVYHGWDELEYDEIGGAEYPHD